MKDTLVPVLAASVRSIGPIFQIAFVPADPIAAIDFWTKTMGVGPFFRRSNIKLPGTLYRGQATNAVYSVAIAYWGDLQVEVVEQQNDEPSIYREWRDGGGEGMHHVCIATADILDARRRCLEAGMTIVQEANYPGGGVFYADTGGGPGTMLEVIQPSIELKQAFAMMRQAALEWDGQEPLRERN